MGENGDVKGRIGGVMVVVVVSFGCKGGVIEGKMRGCGLDCGGGGGWAIGFVERNWFW